MIVQLRAYHPVYLYEHVHPQVTWTTIHLLFVSKKQLDGKFNDLFIIYWFISSILAFCPIPSFSSNYIWLVDSGCNLGFCKQTWNLKKKFKEKSFNLIAFLKPIIRFGEE